MVCELVKIFDWAEALLRFIRAVIMGRGSIYG